MIDFDYAAPELWFERIEWLRRHPSAHVIGGTVYVPVVLCRDCEMFDADGEECMRDPEHTGIGWRARFDGFCAWGVRRDSE